MSIDRKNASIIRSSAAEYLTFITTTGDGGVNAIYADENVWLSQKMIATLYNVEVNTINYHLKKLFKDKELDEKTVIRNFRITAEDEFQKYRVIQDRLFESDFDKFLIDSTECTIDDRGEEDE